MLTSEILAAARSVLKGNTPSKAQGDVHTMPGMFLVRDGEIVWQHDFRFSGDHPDLREVARVAAR